MICGPLGITGLDGLPLLLAALVAIGLIVGGVLLVRSRRRRRGPGFVAALALLVVATLGLSTLGASPAVAEECPTPAPTNSLTITQTAVLSDLEPGDPARAIFGTVTNDGGDDTYIDDIVVSIVGVTLSPAAAGTCTSADFVLLDPVMPVDAPLPPYATLTFGGASIALIDATWNQDACQDATVELRYVTA